MFLCKSSERMYSGILFDFLLLRSFSEEYYVEFAPEKMIAANQAEYKENYTLMRFVSPVEASVATGRREELLQELSGRAQVNCQGTKLYIGELSPGCRTCCDGVWSCLFINGICNGRCFYCPTPQKSKDEPMTNNLRFANPRDYLDYVALFSFRGVSLSGGEPLLTFDRTITYVRKLKQRFGEAIHLWLYTNGMLATEEKIAQLHDAGLDEIRFDISADQYSLEKLRLTVGKIPCVTVEIPAIPEDYEQLRELLPELAATGVDHLNLHQLRCTPHNLPQLLARQYVFSHGPKVVIPESELTALQLLLDAADCSGPAVNYCSYAYKYRFQTRAARRRAATLLAAPYEDVTEAGFVRSLWVTGSEDRLRGCAERLQVAGVAESLYRQERGGRFLFRGVLWPLLDFSELVPHVSYYQTQLQEGVSYRGSHLKVPLNRKRTLVAERLLVEKGRELGAIEQQLYNDFFLAGDERRWETAEEKIVGQFGEIFEYECLPGWLHRYF